MNTNKLELVLAAYDQRITELIKEYEKKLINFRVDATMEHNALKMKIEAMESELQMYREQEMEVSNEKC